jgi:membrane-bound serine protease (ClpP class)
MVKFRRIVVLFSVLLLALSIVSGVRAQGPAVVVLTVKGTIVPVIADYIDQGIRRAEDLNAALCIIELDTPGGLLGSTEKIVQRILNANVPVAVYVTPKGGWAASAGTFITLSANFAVMTPGTTIGAAHPVSGSDQQIPEDEMKKITEFSAKWMKTIAEERGRNADEAQLAVTESKSFSDTDALNAGLIDFQADTLEDLISQVNGREVTLANGAKLTISVTGYDLVRDEMSFIEKFLQAISDSNIAYILMSVATLGIMAELFNPGLIFPGVVGGICLLLAFYALGVLPVNYAGVLLIVLAVGLFVAEVFTPGFGLLFSGGVVALILGSVILFQGAAPAFRVDPWLIAVVVIILAGGIGFILWRAIQIHRKQPATGREELIGKIAMVKVALNPEGMVFYKGENWKAISESGDVKPGEEVIIDRVDSLTLYVKKKSVI